MRKRFKSCFFVAIMLPLIAVLFPYNAISQYSLTGTNYTQNFDGLGSSTNTVTGGNLNNVATSLNGWYFSETLANANTTITSGYGSSTTGDTYNFGITGGTDRTLGGLQSGSLNPTVGFYFVNNTNSTITALTISYSGKTWRVGATGHQDKLQFEYSANATSLTTGSWTAYTALDYQNNSAGAIANGIAGPIQTASISNTVSSLTINDGSSFFIRWTDFDATGADDGLGIDDLTITATTTTTPTISLSTVHPAAANIAAASTNNIIAIYKLFATNAAINITNASFITAGTYVIASDITNFKVWENSIPSISGGTLVNTNTVATSGSTFSVSSGFTSIAQGATGYLIVTVDVASSPTSLRTVSLAADPVTNFTFTSSGTVTKIPSSGSLTTGNPFTIGSAATGGGFQPGKLAVLRIGDGVTTLNTSSFPVDILQFNTTGSAQTGFVSASLPSTAAGSSLTQSGTATTEGELTLSSDGNYVILGGYDAAKLTAAIAAQNTGNVVLGRVAVDGTMNISTKMPRSTSYPGNPITPSNANIRSVSSTDGNSFWASGSTQGGATTGGVMYTTLGLTGNGVQISTTTTNTRVVTIQKNSSNNNQVYVSASSGTIRISSVGIGTPTTSGQTITNLPANIPTSLYDPYGYILLDKDATVAGPDLLYVACMGLTGTAGLYKYSYNGTTWTARGSLTGSIRGVTATINCAGNVDVYYTTAPGSSSRPTGVYKYADGAATTSISGVATTVGTSLSTLSSTVYAFAGGLCFTPLPDVTVSSGTTTLTATTYRNITVNSGATVVLGNDITVLGDIVVNSGGILDCSSYHLFNTADFRSTFTLNSGGTLKIGDPNGITASAASGSVQTCVRTYDAGGNYIYTATTNQVTGNGLPTTITGSVTINNTGIAGDNSVSFTTDNSTVAALNLVAGKLNIDPTGTGNGTTTGVLNISTGGTVTGTGGDFSTDVNGGTLNFPGTGTFSTTVQLNPYNVYASGAVNFGTATNINGTFRINLGGSVNTNPPSYATGSVLQYYSATTYPRALEWSTPSGAGYPFSVQVSNNTTLNYPNGTPTTARNMEGNLTIDAGSVFNMDYGSPGTSAALTINGNIRINGTMSLGDAPGGDLYLGGNWVRNNTTGTFTHNSRTVFFNGGGIQTVTVTSGGTETFYNIDVNKASNDVQLSSSPATNVTVTNTCSLASPLSINGNTLTLNGIITGSGTITGSTASNLTINGSTTSVGTLKFTTGSQTLATLTMNRTGVTGTAALLGSSNDLTATDLVLNNGILTTGDNLLTVTNVSGSASAASAWAANSTEAQLQTSFVALCDGSGTAITDTTGVKGFKIKSVGSTEKIIPIGFNYSSTPNRMALKDVVTTDDYTITLFKGDILGTPKPRVNRIWHIKKSTTASANISMKLYFFKRNAIFGSGANDEIEDGFIWNDARLLHRISASTIPNGGFTNTSSGADVVDFTGNILQTEIYAAYTYLVSGDNTPAQIADGIADFSGISYFSVANAENFILPVTIVNVKAYQQGSAIKIDWTSLTENNVARYEIQRAANALDFTAIGTQAASATFAQEKNYSFTDLLPLNGNNYYRINAIDKDGKVIVSNIVMVTIGKGKEGISIYPNPVKGRAATIQFTNMQKGNYNIVVYSASGAKLLQKKIEHLGGSSAYQFILPQSFASGMYHVRIIGDGIEVGKNLLIE